MSDGGPEIRTLRDLRLVERLLSHPEWQMPTGYEQILPGLLGEMAQRRHPDKYPTDHPDEQKRGKPHPRAGQYVYKPTVRQRAIRIMREMHRDQYLAVRALRELATLLDLGEDDGEGVGGFGAVDDLSDGEVETLAQAARIKRKRREQAKQGGE